MVGSANFVMERIPTSFFFLTALGVYLVGDLWDRRTDVSVLFAFIFLVSGFGPYLGNFFYCTVLTLLFLDVFGLLEFLIELLSRSSKL